MITVNEKEIAMRNAAKTIMVICMMICMDLNILGYDASVSFATEEPNSKPGYSSENPLSLGANAVAVIKTGDWYANLSWETYDAKISLLEIVSGNKAWERIKATDDSNPPPDAGYEYILARIKFEYQATSQPGDKGFELWNERLGSCLIAVSSDGKDYKPALIAPPEPGLKGRLYSGDSCEGWVIFLVSQDDSAPLMTFGRKYDGGVWFNLRQDNSK